MDLGINLHKELAMGHKKAEKEATKKIPPIVKFKKGGSVKKKVCGK